MASLRPLPRKPSDNGGARPAGERPPARAPLPNKSASPRGARASVEIPAETQLSMRVHLRLATVRNLLMRESRLAADRWGLTLPQFDVVAELARADEQGFTFVQISRLLLVTSGNLTGIIDRLEGAGLVRREADARDRRVIRIHLTDKGRSLVQRMLPRHAQAVQALLSFMPKGQLQQLSEMLGDLRTGLRERINARPDRRRKSRRAVPGLRS